MTNLNVFSLEGELALITGGGSGIGLGIAECMIEAGARVVLVGRRESALAEAAEQLGDAATYRVHDITQLSMCEDLHRSIEKKEGPVSILVNNAGIHLKKPAIETTDEEFYKVQQTHVYGAFALTRTFAAPMLEREHGSIIFISSMASILGVPLVIAYTAAKTAYVGIVRGLSAEFAPKGVRVNGIVPGWIDTDMMRKAIKGDPERERKILSRTPQAKFGEIKDIGHAAVFLCSPAAKFVSGCNLPVDGGASIGF